MLHVCSICTITMNYIQFMRHTLNFIKCHKKINVHLHRFSALRVYGYSKLSYKRKHIDSKAFKMLSEMWLYLFTYMTASKSDHRERVFNLTFILKYQNLSILLICILCFSSVTIKRNIFR